MQLLTDRTAGASAGTGGKSTRGQRPTMQVEMEGCTVQVYSMDRLKLGDQEKDTRSNMGGEHSSNSVLVMVISRKSDATRYKEWQANITRVRQQSTA